MKVVLRNPRREVELSGKRRVKELLVELDVLPGTVLVIRGDDLVTADQVVSDADTIELRPVMSGGSEPRRCGSEPRLPGTAHPRLEPGWSHPLP